MKCAICDKTEWTDLDHLRDHKYWYDRDFRYEEPVGFRICKTCGFVTYKDENNLKEIYDRERPVIGVGNIVTCNRKKEYHKKFLDDAIKEKLIKIDKNSKFLDIGCAQGYFLDFMNKHYGLKRENVYGTEFSDKACNYARNYYGFTNIYNDIDKFPDKMDIIVLYHVLEHIRGPYEKLQEIREKLKDDGFIYMSIPVWFNQLNEASGSLTADFENLFHVNHINVFSSQSFHNLLNRVGLEVIKTETRVYGETVLLKKCNPGKNKLTYEKPEVIIDTLERQKKAIELFNAKKFDEAIEQYKDYPDAYIMKSVNDGNSKVFSKQIDILREGIEATNNSLKVVDQVAMIHLQWDEQTHKKNHFYSSNIKTSEKLFKESNAIKLNEQNLFCLGIIEAEYKGNHKRAIEYMKETVRINPGRWNECNSFIGQFASQDWK